MQFRLFNTQRKGKESTCHISDSTGLSYIITGQLEVSTNMKPFVCELKLGLKVGHVTGQ